MIGKLDGLVKSIVNDDTKLAASEAVMRCHNAFLEGHNARETVSAGLWRADYRFYEQDMYLFYYNYCWAMTKILSDLSIAIDNYVIDQQQKEDRKIFTCALIINATTAIFSKLEIDFPENTLYDIYSAEYQFAEDYDDFWTEHDDLYDEIEHLLPEEEEDSHLGGWIDEVLEYSEIPDKIDNDIAGIIYIIIKAGYEINAVPFIEKFIKDAKIIQNAFYAHVEIPKDAPRKKKKRWFSIFGK